MPIPAAVPFWQFDSAGMKIVIHDAISNHCVITKDGDVVNTGT